MAPRVSNKCASCGVKLPPGSWSDFREYEDAIHYFDDNGDIVYAQRHEATIHTDKSQAHPAGKLCKTCNTDASRIWRRDENYLRDLRDLREANAKG